MPETDLCLSTKSYSYLLILNFMAQKQRYPLESYGGDLGRQLQFLAQESSRLGRYVLNDSTSIESEKMILTTILVNLPIQAGKFFHQRSSKQRFHQIIKPHNPDPRYTRKAIKKFPPEFRSIVPLAVSGVLTFTEALKFKNFLQETAR